METFKIDIDADGILHGLVHRHLGLSEGAVHRHRGIRGGVFGRLVGASAGAQRCEQRKCGNSGEFGHCVSP